MAVTAYKTPGTCASVDRGDKAGWLDLDNAKVSNNAYAYTPGDKNDYFDWLRVTNFGFTTSDIPSGATIDGIEIKIEHYGTAADVIKDSALYLRKTSGQVGDNKASASAWATSDEEITYGGAADKWGYAWLASDIISSNFGVDLSPLNTDPDNIEGSYVDVISIRVYYTAPSGDHRRGSFFKMF